MIKSKVIEVKAENGSISGYAATWIREPDSYGDIIAKGAFADCLKAMKEENKVLPLLWNHDSYDIDSYIGTVLSLEEDDHGLKFEATFDDTKEAQRARELATSGRVVKFSFAYDVLDAEEVELEDGRKANELRKLNIHEVSLVLYPANSDTGIISVKSGRRNSAKDEEDLKKITDLAKQIISIINSLTADDIPEGDDTQAKSEEPDTVNDEEQAKVKALLEKAKTLLVEGE